ncbi:MAG: rhomboid family intramembrane serine protease, partial [Gemmatimonadetes bacterium]|nr:rhomboid family intramembrane serine protease [Gemmatimonadota bacterium]
MFPLYDDNPTEIFPVVTLLIMGVCAGLWVFYQGAGFSDPALLDSVCTLGAIPAEIAAGGSGSSLGVSPCPLGGVTWPTLVTS